MSGEERAMQPKVSIVVPVYGCEAYLPECIETLRAHFDGGELV